MPAVTTERLLELPRVPVPDPQAVAPRRVRSITSAPQGFEGEGFPVYRSFAGVSKQTLDPFIHMDQMGEVEYAAGEPKGTPWHPHRGFETVTYLIDGTFVHQDSHGGGGVITDGDTQWMTAGSGLLHIEAPPESRVRSGGRFPRIPRWVNRPAATTWNAPQYQSIEGPEAKLLTTPDGGALLRVIAGEVGEYRGPGSTFTPITLVHATLSPGAKVTLPWNPGFNALAYSLSGRGTVGTDDRPFDAHQLTVFGEGGSITIAATDRPDSRTPNFDVLLLGGQPIREPVFAYGPFVMNTQQEVMQAFEDYQKGKLGVIPADPLPHLGA